MTRGGLVIGVDPGLSTGLLALRVGSLPASAYPPIAVQIHGPNGVIPFVQALLDRCVHDEHVPLIALEQFVIGNRSGRSATPKAGLITRQLITALLALESDAVVRPAATVKPWATDRRLAAAGLTEPTAGMHHARDAARHALYAAVNAGLLADPMRLRAVP